MKISYKVINSQKEVKAFGCFARCCTSHKNAGSWGIL